MKNFNLGGHGHSISTNLDHGKRSAKRPLLNDAHVQAYKEHAPLHDAHVRTYFEHLLRKRKADLAVDKS